MMEQEPRSRVRALLLWSIFTPCLLLAWIAVVFLPRQSWRWCALHLLSRFVFWTWGVSFKRVDADSEPLVSGTVFAANHSSYFDLLAIAAALPRSVSFVAKSELRRPAMLGFALRRIGTQFVERDVGSSHGTALRRMVAAVAAGESILVFPEGTFLAKPGLRRFHMGAFTAAAMAGVPLVPVAIVGTRRLLPKACLRPLPGALTVAFGPTLTAPDGDLRQQAQVLHDQTRAFILDKTGEEDAGS
jgi:1-acyl-sn-glycerol-3-phosphate acyltransferase